nr:uncharacterized protein LOC127347616 [Lolium perenne]
MSPEGTGGDPQAVDLPESIQGRRWADVAAEEDAAEAARAEAAARFSPPGSAILGDYLVYARRGRPRRSPPLRRRRCLTARRRRGCQQVRRALMRRLGLRRQGSRGGGRHGFGGAAGAGGRGGWSRGGAAGSPYRRRRRHARRGGGLPHVRLERRSVLGHLGRMGPGSCWPGGTRRRDASGPRGPLRRPLGSRLRKGSNHLGFAQPARPDQIRRHAASARGIRLHPPLPPLSTSYRDMVLKRPRSPSSSRSPPQHHRRVRPASPRPPPPPRPPSLTGPGETLPAAPLPTAPVFPRRRSPSPRRHGRDGRAVGQVEGGRERDSTARHQGGRRTCRPRRLAGPACPVPFRVAQGGRIAG